MKRKNCGTNLICIDGRFDLAATSIMSGSGPTTGSIYVGHLMSSTAPAEVASDPSLSSDLALKAAYIIEGIHVVPNKITPPNFDIEGKTRPDIHTRPFNLMINARNIDDGKDLVQILTLTITGGCQWIPILPPFNSIAIDHLRFHGDFEIITVIIHGIRLDTQMLSSAAQAVLNNPFSDAATSVKPLKELSDDEQEVEVNIAKMEELASFVIPREVINALQTNVQTCSNILHIFERKKCSDSPDSIIQKLSSNDASRSSCVVAVEIVAELVGAIFSIEDSNACSDPIFAVRTKAINNLVKTLDQCWKVQDIPTTHLFLRHCVLLIINNNP